MRGGSWENFSTSISTLKQLKLRRFLSANIHTLGNNKNAVLKHFSLSFLPQDIPSIFPFCHLPFPYKAFALHCIEHLHCDAREGGKFAVDLISGTSFLIIIVNNFPVNIINNSMTRTLSASIRSLVSLVGSYLTWLCRRSVVAPS